MVLESLEQVSSDARRAVGTGKTVAGVGRARKGIKHCVVKHAIVEISCAGISLDELKYSVDHQKHFVTFAKI